MKQLDAMYQRAMGMIAPKPDPSKGKTKSEWSALWGKSRNTTTNQIKVFLEKRLMVSDTDWRAVEGNDMPRKTTVYRWSDKMKGGAK